MAFSFSCDICGVQRTRDEGAGQWFTLAVELGGRAIRVFRWPTGSSLKEVHDSLHHLCSRTHLQEFIHKWATTEEAPDECENCGATEDLKADAGDVLLCPECINLP
jgi:hypothetical protein